MDLGEFLLAKTSSKQQSMKKNQELIDAFKEQLLEDVKLFQTQLEKDRVAVLAYLMIEVYLQLN